MPCHSRRNCPCCNFDGTEKNQDKPILWQEWMLYNSAKGFSLPRSEKQPVELTLVSIEEGNVATVARQPRRLPEPAPHSAALVRKVWQVSRKLLNEFWDNCKVRPDLRILFGYVSRALREGYKEESIWDAFVRSLHQCHGHATDCGEIWAPSSTVHRAEKWLREHGLLWQPTPPEERRRIRAEITAAMKAWEEQP